LWVVFTVQHFNNGMCTVITGVMYFTLIFKSVLHLLYGISHHKLGMEYFIEFFCGKESESYAGFLK